MTAETDPLSTRPLHLELGCGGTKRNSHAVGVDQRALPGVDVVGDALSVLGSLAEASVASISSEHFMEHLDDPRALVAASARVLQDGGEFRCVVPHFSNAAYHSDPTHRTPFGLYTFGYWLESTPLRRQVPHYDEALPFALESVRFGFKSSRPFYVRHAIVKVSSSWVNVSTWTKELYEERLCWLMPAYEIEFVLRRNTR